MYAAMPTTSNSRVLGIGLMMVTLVLFACQDVSAKYLAAFFPVPFIVWCRFVSNLALSAAQSGLAGSNPIKDARTGQPGLQLLRSGLLVTTTVLYFYGLKELQLATASSIFFMYPLIIAMLAPILIGERLPARRWSLIVIGFLGVLLVIKPGTPSFDPATLLVVLAALSFSLFSITTRKLAITEPIRTTNIYTGLVGAVVMLPALLLLGGDWVAPTNPWVWVLTFTMGMAFGGLGHLFLLHAHRYVPAPELAPWFYVEILWIVAAGYVFFDEIPDRHTILGCSMVAGASLLVLRIELTNARRLAAVQASTPHD